MPSSLATATTSSTSGTAYIVVSPLFIAAPRPAGPQPRDGLRRALRAEWSECRAPQHARIDLARHQLSVAGRAQQLAVRHHDFPSQNHRRRPALDLPALPGTVVPYVQVGHTQGLLDRRIDDGDVGVAAHRDGALLRIETEELGGIGGGDGRIVLDGHAASEDGLRAVAV